MNFLSDALFDGLRLRPLTIVDKSNPECLEIKVAQNLRGEEIIAVLEKLRTGGSMPVRIQVDNGSDSCRWRRITSPRAMASH